MKLVKSLLILLSVVLCTETASIVLGDAPNVFSHPVANVPSYRTQPPVSVNWASVMIGQQLAQGYYDGTNCVVPPTKIHIPGAAGKKRSLQTIVNQECQLVVLDKGQIDSVAEIHSSANKGRVEVSARLGTLDKNSLDLLQAKVKTGRGFGGSKIDSEYTHGHAIFVDNSNIFAMQVHMAFNFYWDGDFAAFDGLPIDANPPTYSTAPGWDGGTNWMDVDNNCGGFGVGVPTYCYQGGNVIGPGSDAGASVTAWGGVDGSYWCDIYWGASGIFNLNSTFCEGPKYLHP